MEALSAASSLFNHPVQVHAAEGSESPFKLMLVHDGYERIHPLIDDLKTCGFPANTEVLLLSVGDLFRTPLHLIGTTGGSLDYRAATRIRSLVSYRQNQEFLNKLDLAKREAYAELVSAFPHWHISSRQTLGWQPDLIFFGAYNRSLVQNPGLAEIIRKINAESNIPFRVARPRPPMSKSPGALMIAFDSPPSAVAVLTALRCRLMNRGIPVHLMFYLDPLTAQAQRWSAGYEEPDREWIDSQLVRTKRAIEAFGYSVSCVNTVGNTAQTILNEAKRIGAESILLGTRPLQKLGDLSWQSIAIVVGTQAECSVELVFAAPQERLATTLHAVASSKATARREGTSRPCDGSVTSLQQV